MTSGFRSCDRYSGNDLCDLSVENLHFRTFCRMSYSDFDALINLVGPRINKKDTLLWKAIPVAERLPVTLRFLASGDSFTSLSYLFKMSKLSVSTSIHFIFHFCHTDAKFFRKLLPRIILFIDKFIKLMGSVPQNHMLFVLALHHSSTPCSRCQHCVSSELHVSPSFTGLRASLWCTDNRRSHTSTWLARLVSGLVSTSTYERATTASTSSLDAALDVSSYRRANSVSFQKTDAGWAKQTVL